MWEIALDATPKLGSGAVLAVLAVATFTDGRGVASPSQATLARLTGRSERTIRTAVKAAERAGIFARARKGSARGRTRYTFAVPTVAQARRAFAHSLPLEPLELVEPLPVCGGVGAPLPIWKSADAADAPARPQTPVAGLTASQTARPAIPGSPDRQPHLPLKTPEEEKLSDAGAQPHASARPETPVAGLPPIQTARPAEVPQASPTGAASRAIRPETPVAGLPPTPTGRPEAARSRVLYGSATRSTRAAAYEIRTADFRPPWPATPPWLQGRAARLAAYLAARPAIPEAPRAEGPAADPTAPPPDGPEPAS